MDTGRRCCDSEFYTDSDDCTDSDSGTEFDQYFDKSELLNDDQVCVAVMSTFLI